MGAILHHDTCAFLFLDETEVPINKHDVSLLSFHVKCFLLCDNCGVYSFISTVHLQGPMYLILLQIIVVRRTLREAVVWRIVRN